MLNNKTMSTCDLMVVSKNQHLVFRGVAAFLIAPYLVYTGRKYNNNILILIGIGTFIIDLYTFIKTLNVETV